MPAQNCNGSNAAARKRQVHSTKFRIMQLACQLLQLSSHLQASCAVAALCTNKMYRPASRRSSKSWHFPHSSLLLFSAYIMSAPQHQGLGAESTEMLRNSLVPSNCWCFEPTPVLASRAIFHFSPVENADTAPGLAGLGLVSGDATGTFRTVDGRLVTKNLLLGAGAKAMPGLLFLRVHSASYLHTSNIVTCAPLSVHWCALSNRLPYSLPQQSQLRDMGPGRCPAWVPIVLTGTEASSAISTRPIINLII